MGQLSEEEGPPDPGRREGRLSQPACVSRCQKRKGPLTWTRGREAESAGMCQPLLIMRWPSLRGTSASAAPSSFDSHCVGIPAGLCDFIGALPCQELQDHGHRDCAAESDKERSGPKLPLYDIVDQ